MAKDKCEAIITKRLAWLLEPLVFSSLEFSFLFYFVLDKLSKITNIILLCFPLLRVSPYSSLFISLFYFLFILSNIEEPITYT